MKKEDLEQVLSFALRTDETDMPTQGLQEGILKKAKEEGTVKRRHYRKGFAVAAMLVLILGVGSISATAAYKYLTAGEAVGAMEDGTSADTLHEALEEGFKSEDSVSINETQTTLDYKITLLGILSGEDLIKNMSEESRENLLTGLMENMTYVVYAMEHADGTPVDKEDPSEFCSNLLASEMIGGREPAYYEEFDVANYVGSGIYENGMIYWIRSVKNLDMYADRGVYLGIVEDGKYEKAYKLDEETGEIVKNPECTDLNAVLFKLPIPADKADAEKAAAYEKKWEYFNGKKFWK